MMELLFAVAHAAVGDPGYVDFSGGRIAGLAAIFIGVVAVCECVRSRWGNRQRFRRGLRAGTVQFAVMFRNAAGKTLWEPVSGGMLAMMRRGLQVRGYQSLKMAEERALELARNPECDSVEVVCWDGRRRRYLTWDAFNQRG